MSDLILHHYDLSPFAEKVRLTMGYKGLSWHSVEVPIWPPRPDLMPLTAGYRRVPVLQVGADVYCDTLLILRELDRRHPEPTLYPDEQTGLNAALSQWVDEACFMPAAALTTSIIGDTLPAEFLADRIAFMKHDFSREASLRDLPVNRQRMHAALDVLADLLKDGRPFLLGRNLSAADLSAYHTLWFTRKNGGAEAEAMLPLGKLLDWMERVAAVGHGERQVTTGEAALEAARSATPETPPAGVAPGDPCGLVAGAPVLVRTQQEGDPIRGTLVAATPDRLTIRHENEQAGTVHVHFPRLGYSLVAAD